MKFIDLKTQKIEIPLKAPIQTRYQKSTNVKVLVVTLILDTGCQGQGYIYNLGDWGLSVCDEVVHAILKPKLLGLDFTSIEEIHNELWSSTRNHLGRGFGMYALSLVDIALWDLKVGQAKCSLTEFIGKKRDFVPVYGSGGWLTMTEMDLLKEVEWYIERGVCLYKIRIGSSNDERRLRLLRKTYGSNLDIAVDANQHFSLNDAVKIIPLLEKYNIAWFEEPLEVDSVKAYKFLKSCCKNMPIALGENLALQVDFDNYCDSDICEIAQPDVGRCGGITNILKIAKFSATKKVRLFPHLMTSLSVSIMGTLEDGYVEHLRGFSGDYLGNEIDIVDGHAKVPCTVDREL